MGDLHLFGSAHAKTLESSRVLSGWKEIATYMGRGVRTVQRWEKLGLPVRRPNAHLRSAVLASTGEIDSWIAGCVNGRQGDPDHAPAQSSEYNRLRSEVDQLRVDVESMRRELDLLKRQSPHVQQPGGKAAHAQHHTA